MPAVGGSSIDISINGRSFGIAEDADISQSLKKFENEVRANGNGTARVIRKKVVQSFEGITVAIDDTLQDFEYLSDMYELVNVDFSVTLPSGAIYAGRGTLTGELKRGTEAATAEISISGVNFKKQ